MTFGTSIKNALRLFTLDEAAISGISKEKESTGFGILIIIIAGFCIAVGMLLTSILMPSFQTKINEVGQVIIIAAPVMLLLFSFIGIAVMFLIGRLFKGKAMFIDYYRPYSHIYISNWIAIIPVAGLFLSALAGVYQIIQGIVITKTIQQVSMFKAALIILIPFAVVFILGIALGIVFWRPFTEWFFTVSPLTPIS
ncbi:MAG: YIP1 family protein [Nanoarchaeota archaeon]